VTIAERNECAKEIHRLIASRADFFDSLGPERAREGRIGAAQAVALEMIRSVIEAIELRSRIADISTILDAVELVIGEQGPPPRLAAQNDTEVS
jgi:hypothetical protein